MSGWVTLHGWRWKDWFRWGACRGQWWHVEIFALQLGCWRILKWRTRDDWSVNL
jgi:hypothetical protein